MLGLSQSYAQFPCLCEDVANVENFTYLAYLESMEIDK